MSQPPVVAVTESTHTRRSCGSSRNGTRMLTEGGADEAAGTATASLRRVAARPAGAVMAPPVISAGASRWHSTSGRWITDAARPQHVERALVFEGRRIGRRVRTDVAQQGGADRQRPPDVPGGAEEVGRIVGFEARHLGRAAVALRVLVGVGHTVRGHRPAE